MPKLVGAIISVLGGMAATAAAVGPTALGCATSVNPADLAANDAAAPDAVAPTNETGAVDNAGQNDAANALSAADSGGRDVTDAGIPADAGNEASFADTTTASDAAVVDADAASADADSGGSTDADAGSGADADAATPCNTAAILFADAGATGGALLFAFDNGAGASSWLGKWDFDPTDAAAPPTLAGVDDAGHSCPGALRATFEFTTYAQQAEVQYNYRPPPSYAAGTNVHMWVKLVVFGGGYQDFNDLLGPVTQWTTGTSTTWAGDFPSQYPPNFADGNWHECVAPLGPTDAGRVNVNFEQLAAYLQSQWSDAGPRHRPAVMYLDDIWIE